MGEMDGTLRVRSEGDDIILETELGEIKADWETMRKVGNKILSEANDHKTDLEKAEEISGAWIRVSCDCCEYEQEFEHGYQLRDRGETPEEHAEHPDCESDPEDVSVEAFCPRHGTIPLVYDECDDCAYDRQVMMR